LLLAQDLLYFADLLLDFAANFFVLAFGFQVRIIDSMANFLFDRALHFVALALDLIFGAFFHGFYLRKVSSTFRTGGKCPRLECEPL
jgi:hypothetical protein